MGPSVAQCTGEGQCVCPWSECICPHFTERKLRLRQAQPSAPSHFASKWRSQPGKPGLSSASSLFPLLPCSPGEVLSDNKRFNCVSVRPSVGGLVDVCPVTCPSCWRLSLCPFSRPLAQPCRTRVFLSGGCKYAKRYCLQLATALNNEET